MKSTFNKLMIVFLLFINVYLTMGGQQSKTSYAQLMNVITNVISKDVQDCSSFTAAKQTLDVQGSGNIIKGVTMVQSATINSDCVGKKVKNVDIQNKIKSALDQYAKNQGLGGLSALDRMSSSDNASIVTNITNNITTENIQKCVSSVNQKQDISVVGERNIIQDVAMKQTMDQFKTCLSDTLNNTGIKDSLESITKQTSKTKADNPVAQVVGKIGDAITAIPQTILWIIGGFIFFIFLVIIGIVVSRMGRGGNQKIVYVQQPEESGMAPVIEQ